MIFDFKYRYRFQKNTIGRSLFEMPSGGLLHIIIFMDWKKPHSAVQFELYKLYVQYIYCNGLLFANSCLFKKFLYATEAKLCVYT